MVPFILQFGPFELNTRAESLKKNGMPVKLAPQPLKLLMLLAGRAGELVTREEIQQELWSNETFVDFQQSMNQYIRQIRSVLGDDAETPTYVETVPRRGYRFVATVTKDEGDVGSEAAARQPSPPQSWSQAWLGGIDRSLAIIGLAAILLAITGLVTYRRQAHALGFPAAVHAIAVLPLENLTGDSSQEYFAQGMTDALINNLARIKSIQVRPFSSVMRFANNPATPAEIERALAVDALVKGSITMVGDRVRITAQIVEPRQGKIVWVKSYDTALNELINAESKLALLIGREVSVTLDPEEERDLSQTVREPLPSAYMAYLRGHYLYNKQQRNKTDVQNSCEAFHQAIELDSSFAPAYAGMAECLQWQETRAFISYNDSRAGWFAARAVELDPASAHAHSILGAVRLYHDWDWQGAQPEFEKALQLDPNDSNAHFMYSEYLKVMGRLPEALAEIRRAQELDPLEFHYLLSSGYFLLYMHYFNEAELEFRKILQVAPQNGSALSGLIEAYEKQGMFQQAAEYRDKFERADDEKLPVALFMENFKKRGYDHARQEYLEAALHHGEELRRHGTQWENLNLAYLNAQLGRKSEALRFLETAYQAHMTQLINIKIDSRFDGLRSDPRFQDLLARMRLN